jgi:hypothetical protein
MALGVGGLRVTPKLIAAAGEQYRATCIAEHENAA